MNFKGIFMVLLFSHLIVFMQLVQVINGQRSLPREGISIECANRILIGAQPCSTNELSNRIDQSGAQCRGVGESCNLSESCCSRRCLSSIRRCVT